MSVERTSIFFFPRLSIARDTKGVRTGTPASVAIAKVVLPLNQALILLCLQSLQATPAKPHCKSANTHKLPMRQELTS
ncbi:J domain-containing protein [Psidium guajava]|nr:J domain-containing protein [Psidium guajava]